MKITVQGDKKQVDKKERGIKRRTKGGRKNREETKVWIDKYNEERKRERKREEGETSLILEQFDYKY